MAIYKHKPETTSTERVERLKQIKMKHGLTWGAMARLMRMSEGTLTGCVSNPVRWPLSDMALTLAELQTGERLPEL